MYRNALYTGSFDPFTNGHLNVLDQAVNIFDKTIVCVMNNPHKERFVDFKTSEILISEIIKERYNSDIRYKEKVKVITPYTNLAYKQAQECDCHYLIRGIRNNGIDYNYEENLAEFNKEIGGIDTIFIRANDYKNVSSTMIKTLYNNREIDKVEKYVPKQVYEYLHKRVLCLDCI